MSSKPKVLVTRRWPEAVEARLCDHFDAEINRSDRPLSADDFRGALTRYDAVLPTVTDRLGAQALDVCSPRTRLLANYGVGYSHIDMDRVANLGMTVTNTPDVLSACTADLTLALMLMTARRLDEGSRELRDGAWTGWRPTHLIGSKVSGKTLGIVGFGRIGQEVARRAHHGFGMQIVVQSRRAIDPDLLASYGARQVDRLEDLLPVCDFVSLHCPGGAARRHMIGDVQLNLMKPDAFLINTARGELIDEAALARALWFDTIAGAGLDVFSEEPRIPEGLRDCDTLVMLPHMGSATREAREAMGHRVIDNLIDFFEGRDPRDRVS